MRIVYMGTPDFAVASLDILVNAGYNIVGVITAPDKPAGRGLQMNQSAVKQYALTKGLNVLQPTNLKSEIFLEELHALKADLQIVVAFRMLPEVVWAMPAKGTFNLHASLLPQYRGAAPINWAVVNGERETGVTTFFLEKEIDTGKIILQEKVKIDAADTAGVLHDKLMTTGAVLVLKTVQLIETGNYNLLPQSNTSELKSAPKISKENCKIDWSQNVNSIYNHIRGFSPYPGAWTILDGKILKIFSTDKELTTSQHPIGNIISDGKSFLKFTANDGYLSVKELQLEGKKKMGIDEFLRGYGNKLNT